MNSIEKARCGPAVARAIGIGRARAAFFGTSSPNSIEKSVARTSARTWSMPSVARPAIGRTAGSTRRARAGSAR